MNPHAVQTSANIHCHSLNQTTILQEESSDVLDSRGIPGWGKVHRLAEALLGLTHLYMTESQAQTITHLYEDLSEFARVFSSNHDP